MERESERSFLQGLGERAERVIRDLGERVQERLQTVVPQEHIPLTEHVAAVTATTSEPGPAEEGEELRQYVPPMRSEDLASTISEGIGRYPLVSFFLTASLGFLVGRLLVSRR